MDQSELKLLTTVPSSAEAVILIGDLDSMGIPAAQRSSAHVGGIFGSPLRVDIYVRADDLERARQVLSEPVSEDELLHAEEEGEEGG
jgi:Putative prokaryotic signal transducing protein